MSIERIIKKPCREDIENTRKPEIAFGLRGEDLYDMIRSPQKHTNGPREARKAQKL